MKQYIEIERAIGLERSQVNTANLDQVYQAKESAPFDEMNAAIEAMTQQEPEDSTVSTSRSYNLLPLQSGNPIEQFCILAAPNDPEPRKTREVLENAGLRVGCVEHTATRAKAAEVAANYPVVPSPGAVSVDEDEAASDLESDTDLRSVPAKIEVDDDAELPSLDTVLQSFRSSPRQGPRPGQRRVRNDIRKRRRSSSEDEKVLKCSKRSSGTSMDVNVEPRTESEERNECLCDEAFEEASRCSMHGVGGWS